MQVRRQKVKKLALLRVDDGAARRATLGAASRSMFRKLVGCRRRIGECHVSLASGQGVVDDVLEQTLNVLHSSNRGANSAWIAAWPAPAFNLREELADDP